MENITDTPEIHEAPETVESKHGGRRFIRLNRSEKIQHWIFLGCFIILAITGFMAKLPGEIVDKMGEAKGVIFLIRGDVHRIAGAVMILISLYHILYLFFNKAGRRWLADMLPRLKDLKDALHNVLYLIGMKDASPEFDRFSYQHKVEYWALISGSTIMSVTGILLWTQDRWNKFIIDIAMLVHGMEAILAVLAIMVWHMYEIHLRPGRQLTDDHWLTGVIDEEDMKEEHAFHYKKIMEDTDLQKIYIKETVN
jgi:cytochrome b subunit of formate dehydrogenase